MNAIDLFRCGYDYKAVKSILENYCSNCFQLVPENKGAWTNSGNECDLCLAKKN